MKSAKLLHNWPADVAAAIILVVGMGFGRFAFTGLYPLMVNEQILTIAGGSWAASANYAGYLAGALAMAKLSVRHAVPAAVASLLATVAALALLGWTDTVWAVVLNRGLAGVFSAVAMVAGSLWLLQYMGRPHSAPLLYAGVGMGIFLSAELIALGAVPGWGSLLIWRALAAVALLLALFACAVLWRSRRDLPLPQAVPKPGAAAATAAAFAGPWLLIAVYGLAGLGYIITATYLPVLISGALGGAAPIHVWAAFGLGAVPSCFLWHRINLRFGVRISLALNLLLQGFGVLLPVLHQSLWAYLGSAILVGGTFMGTVTIAMPAARQLSTHVNFNMLAVMTAAYGIGQIVGPIAANAIFDYSGSFAGSLVFAAVALWVAAVLCRPKLGRV
ncbi:YbfB/YjiJ family MFS transporter [Uruburuella testudinis]|uniref:YbfB/YjiJ family MFS transporter n=1 Tax=Uruburuella testudinis TaxID=1282863 RepID=A0ABY4E0W6_9NEIS|nr:YbfB/YjiJ family MFS transporter [Uruburuella testudinis]UOO82611.1 YbfB/YjiJ family MFS transporter [Uruburuella testudinis]